MRTWLLHLSISGGILALLLWRARVWELGDVFQGFEAWAAVVVLALNVPILLTITLRSRLVLARIHGEESFWGLIPIAAVGSLAGQLTPANAGDLWRAYAYKREYGVPVSQGAAAVVYERLMSFYLMALVAAGLGFYQIFLSDIGAATLLLVAAGVVAMAFLPTLSYAALRAAMTNRSAVKAALAVAERTPLRALRSTFQEAEGSLRLLFEDRSLTLAFAGATGVYLALGGLQVWALIVALDLGLQFQEAWLVLVASAVVGAASSLPFGLGITDSALVLLLGSYGVGVGPAATVSILVRGLVTLPLGLVAVGSYLIVSSSKTRAAAARQTQKGLVSLRE